MKQNIGTIDRVLRVILALTVGVLYFTGILSGTITVVLAALAMIFLATSFIGSCPIYSVCRISTRKQTPTN